MAKNRIEKQKSALIGLAVAAIVVGVAALVGGVVALIVNAKGMAKALDAGTNPAGSIVLMVLGILLGIIGLAGIVWGVYYAWIGGSIKATHGSISEDNLSKGTVNGKVCPKCGCTNTCDSTECAVCHTPLE